MIFTFEQLKKTFMPAVLGRRDTKERQAREGKREFDKYSKLTANHYQKQGKGNEGNPRIIFR